MNGDCTVGVENRQRIIALEKDVGEVKDINDSQWTAIKESHERYEEALRQVALRLPNWAVAAAGVGTLIIGVLGTLLAMR